MFSFRLCLVLVHEIKHRVTETLIHIKTLDIVLLCASSQNETILHAQACPAGKGRLLENEKKNSRLKRLAINP